MLAGGPRQGQGIYARPARDAGRKSARHSPLRLDAFLFEIGRSSAKRARRLSAGNSVKLIPAWPWARDHRPAERVTHGYDQVDGDELWQVIERDLPELISPLERIRAKLKDDSSSFTATRGLWETSSFGRALRDVRRNQAPRPLFGFRIMPLALRDSPASCLAFIVNRLPLCRAADGAGALWAAPGPPGNQPALRRWP